MKRTVLTGFLAALTGCTSCQLPSTADLPPSDQVSDGGLGSFQVTVTSVLNQDGTAYGPGDGSAANPYPFDEYLLTFHVFVQALDQSGLPDPTFNRQVSVRITPGDLDTDGGPNWLAMNNGVAQGDIVATHVFGATSVWALDEPPVPVYVNDTILPSGYDAGPPAYPDGGFAFTYAAGTSPAIYFNSPTIQQMKRTPSCDPAQSFAPTGISGKCTTNAECKDTYLTQYQCWNGACAGTCDNRTAALDGDFVIMDQPPPLSDMVVTDITSDGFYVSDLAALKPYYAGDPQLTIDWGALPGTFNSIFVYTYSAPTNLYVGNHLLSLAGSVQEFSGDTQLDFPSWIVLDAIPSKDYMPTHILSEEEDCTVGNSGGAEGVDLLCAYYNSNMSVESRESTPVQLVNVRPTNVFVDCDYNGDGKLPLFADSSTTFVGLPGSWGCFADDPEIPECACYISCTAGIRYPDTTQPGQPIVDLSSLAPANADEPICSELSTFDTYKQWNVVMYSEDAGAFDLPDGGYDGYSHQVRVEVDTGDALPNFDPRELTQPQHQQITFDITGMLNQIQASRPRWLVYARQPSDICCHGNAHPDGDGGMTGICPDGVTDCTRVGNN